MKEPRQIVEVHASVADESVLKKLDVEGYCVVVVRSLGYIRIVPTQEKQDD